MIAPPDTRALIHAALAGDDGAARTLRTRVIDDRGERGDMLVAILLDAVAAERDRLATGLLDVARARGESAIKSDYRVGIVVGYESAAASLLSDADLHAEAERIRAARAAAIALEVARGQVGR